MKQFVIFFVLIMLAFSCQQERASSNHNGQDAFETAMTRLNVKNKRTIGVQILDARLKKGISQEDLAKEIGLSKKNIETIETNRAIPTRDMIISLQEALSVELVIDTH